jgi:hypothetical protein
VLLGRSGEPGFALPSEGLADGSRAVPVFGDAAGAETFRVVEGLGHDWRVVDDTPRRLAGFLGAAAMGGARYVELGPPTALTRGHEEDRLVPLSAFLDRLLAAQARPETRPPEPATPRPSSRTHPLEQREAAETMSSESPPAADHRD